MTKTVLRLLGLLSVELVRPGTYADLDRLIEAPAAAAVPAARPASEMGRIAVTTVGKGPDVILIPGLASSANVWDATVAHLLSGHRVHVVQVAGFARRGAGSQRQRPVTEPVVAAIHDYIAANHLAGAAVIGHSLGGLIAMKLAIAHPGDAGRIMVVDALPFFGMAMMGPQATVAQIEPMAAAMRARVQGESQAEFAASEPAQMTRLVKSHDAAAAAAVAAASASDPKVVGQAFYEDATADIRPDLGRIAVPVTMLYPYDPATGASRASFDALTPAPSHRCARRR